MIDNERAAAAIKIILNPGMYKICEGCDSIVGYSTIICPNCHSYRYETNTIKIALQAEKLASSEQQSVTKDDLF